MSKSILSVAREIEKHKPIYVAMRKVMRWYDEHPHTKGDIASRVSDLHERVDTEHAAMDERHANELLPILKIVEEARARVKDAQTQATAMGLKHRQEKEDITLAFAVAELDLLQGKITEVPEHLKPLNARPSRALGIGLSFASWLRRTFKPKQADRQLVNSPEKAQS